MTSTPPAAARPVGWRRRLIVIASLSLVLLICALGGLLCAAAYRPAWYRPAAVNYERLPADKHSFVALLDSVSAALNRGEPIDLVIEQDQFNRWLAARDEVFPPDWQRFRQLRDPFVEILPDNRLRLAAIARRHGFAAVVSIELRAALEPQELQIEPLRVRIGTLPVPAATLIRIAAPYLPDAMHQKLAGATPWLRVRNRLTWPNGKRRFVITRISTQPGRLQLRLEPLEP